MADKDTNGSSWRAWAMGIMVTIICGLIGILVQDSREAAKMALTKSDAQEAQIRDWRERTIRLEQMYQYQQSQLDRIEEGVNEVRKRR